MIAQRGQLATSIAGRDVGHRYLILDCLDKHFVLIADGDKRPVVNPKKKNVRHLELHEVVAPIVEARLVAGELVSDAEVRAVLEQLQSSSEEVD